MAYDEALADRIRPVIELRADVTERKMFGGIGWMLGGNMAVGIMGDELLVRLDPDDADQALTEPGVRVFDFTGRPARGMVVVSGERVAEDDELTRWIDAGADHAASLPPKQPKKG